jgi:UDP-glucuronate 4-epimerase
MKILITGVGGFIGFSFANFLLSKNSKVKVYGLDNYDDYYDVNFKKKRISLLKKKIIFISIILILGIKKSSITFLKIKN